MGPKIYTAREANGLIPDLERLLDELDGVRAKMKRTKGKADVLEMLWGDEVQGRENPDHREYDHLNEELDKLRKNFEGVTQKIADLEAVPKSVEHGLIDFYGVIEGRLIFLCWKRGETSIEYYHHLEDGFKARQPIPAQELAR